MKTAITATTFGSLLLLSACQVWTGPGTYDDFVEALTSCVSSAPLATETYFGLNEEGANFSSSTAPSCSVINACMASKGYFQDREGQFDASALRLSCN